jgi:murein DD-endopeptidase MepM/ murein hydrolase activator NlpD
MAGDAPRLAHDVPKTCCCIALLVLLVAGSVNTAIGQELYKYRGADGEWIYADRPPEDGETVEKRELESRRVMPEVTVTHQVVGRVVRLNANNQFYAPVELILDIQEISGLEFPESDQEFRWMLPPRSDTTLFSLNSIEDTDAPFIQFQFTYLPGDPEAEHRPTEPYRVPFAIANDYRVSQAYPAAATHTLLDSQYAVDVAMPIGTDVFAARGGIVFDVASDNYRAGLDFTRDGPAANVVRILHEDGTYAVYAHLNWNTIRVNPGQRVSRGEYIADSGNTGFSSGPHLHFAVVQNTGMRIESLPVEFQGRSANPVTPATGAILTAY